MDWSVLIFNFKNIKNTNLKFMKTYIYSLITCFVFTLINAQVVQFGIKGGANVSIFGNNVKSKIGFQGGGFAKIELSDKFFLQPELLYMQQGLERDNFSLPIPGVTSLVSGNLKITYLNVPLLIKYYPYEKLFLEAGPQIGLLLSAKGNASYEGNNYDLDFKDNFKNIDLGMNVGVGYDLSDKFSIAMRYNVGTTKMANTDYVADFYNRNSFISLSVAYTF